MPLKKAFLAQLWGCQGLTSNVFHQTGFQVVVFIHIYHSSSHIFHMIEYYCSSNKCLQTTGCLTLKCAIVNGSDGWKDQYFVDFSLEACSGALGIWVSSINFNINDRACPPQPQIWRIPKLNLKFHDSTKKNYVFKTSK